MLADAPVYAHGLAELVGRVGTFDVVAATTDLDEVVDLVGSRAARLVVLSTPATAARQALVRIMTAATRANAMVGTVHVVPAEGSWSMEATGPHPSAVVSTQDGVDGLIRAVFEARKPRRPSAHTAHRSRPPSVRQRPGSGRPALTPRELEVLQGLADGLGSKHIAERLGVSVHTVRTHVQRLLPKLGAHSRLRATAVALEEGLVAQPGPSRLAVRYATTAAGERSEQTAD